MRGVHKDINLTQIKSVLLSTKVVARTGYVNRSLGNENGLWILEFEKRGI